MKTRTVLVVAGMLAIAAGLMSRQAATNAKAEPTYDPDHAHVAFSFEPNAALMYNPNPQADHDFFSKYPLSSLLSERCSVDQTFDTSWIFDPGKMEDACYFEGPGQGYDLWSGGTVYTGGMDGTFPLTLDFGFGNSVNGISLPHDTAPGRRYSLSISIRGTATLVDAYSATGTAVFTVSNYCEGVNQLPCVDNGFYVGVGEMPFTAQWDKPFMDATIANIEVVQMVQTASNTVPLIANKLAVARVFARSSFDLNGALVSLTATKDGIPVPGTPVLLPGSSSSALREIDRNLASHSFNYLLPPDWLGPGTLTLTAELVSVAGAPAPLPASTAFTGTFVFQQRNALEVQYVILCFEDPLQNCPSRNAVALASSALKTFYPTYDNGVTYRKANLSYIYELEYPTSKKDVAKVTRNIAKRYLETSASIRPDQLAAWASPWVGTTLPGQEIILGSSEPLWHGGSGRASFNVFDPNDIAESELTLVHELFHNFGVQHPNTIDSCGAKHPGTNWPYADATIQDPGWAMQRLSVVSSSTKDLMSYCLGNRWVSPSTYTKVFEANGVPQSRSLASASTHILLSGSVKGGSLSASLDPAIYIVAPDDFTPSDSGAPYCIRFDEDDSSDYCFNLSFDLDGETLEFAYFVKSLPIPPQFSSVALRAGDETLATVVRTASSPTVEIHSPIAGSSWTGTQTITWSGSDNDNDTLTYTVFHSADSGENWVPILTDSTKTELTLDTEHLAGGPEGLIKVVASDGLNNGQAEVGPLTVGTARPWGDLDCTGTIGLSDVLILSRSLAGLPVEISSGCSQIGALVTVFGEPETNVWGDVTCNDAIDAADVLFIMRSLVGLAVLNPGCPSLGSLVYATH